MKRRVFMDSLKVDRVRIRQIGVGSFIGWERLGESLGG